MQLISNSILLLAVSLQVYSASAAGACKALFNSPIAFSSRTVQPRNSNEFSVVTWNAHKLGDKKFLPDLASLSLESDLILIQEAMHSQNIETQFINQVNFNFSFHESFCTSDTEATGVMTASRYNLEKNTTLVSPNTEPITFTPKVSGYSAIQVPEIGVVHVINTHALNFNLGSKFETQINAIADFISHLEGPVIWAGDFNTWTPGRKHILNSKAQQLGLTHLAPARDHRNLVLDHIYTRGLEALDVQVLDQIKSSDHYPMKATFRKR